MYKKYLKYIKGDEFHNGLQVKLTSNKMLFRNKYLLNLVKGKKIVHVGFVDHLPLIDEKIKNKNWLHNQLLESSNKCIGIDINSEGIDYLKNKYLINDIYALDIMTDQLPEDIKKEHFDYLLLPDVIEHIGNPVSFLKGLKNKFPNVDKFIFTTPNATCYDNIKYALKNIECINTDHRFWFTPYTITKILCDSGYEVCNIFFAEHSSRLSRINIFKNFIILNKQFFRDNLIIEAK